MDISCDIIKDILPLYAENMVSNATRNMVDEHLCKCDGCAKELDSLKRAQPVPGDVEITYADVTQLEQDFGFRPKTELRKGLRKFAEWYYGYYVAEK